MTRRDRKCCCEPINQWQRTFQFGVASIEYAFIASLISVVVITVLRAVGNENLNIWTYWTGMISTALGGVL